MSHFKKKCLEKSNDLKVDKGGEVLVKDKYIN